MNAYGELQLFEPLTLVPTDEGVEKAKINAMTFEDMLRTVRRAPLDHPLFRGEIGRHFHAVMRVKRHALSSSERAAISKKVGF